MYETSPESSPKMEPSDIAQHETYDIDVETSIFSNPELLHTLHYKEASVLSIAADASYIYSGSQAKDIFVWDRRNFQLKATLSGHTESVLALETSEERGWLFSASGDSTVRIWSTTKLSPLYIIFPHLDTDSGDIYSLTYSPTLSRIYFGCQDTSIQWFDLSPITSPSHDGLKVSTSLTDRPPTPLTPGKRFHKFFDSVPQSMRSIISHRRQTSGDSLPSQPGESIPELRVPQENVIPSAHYGYVYSMALSPSHLFSGDTAHHSHIHGSEVYLLTGSGDETVKMWLATKEGLEEKYTFSGAEGAVLSLVVRNGTLYAGCQDGNVKVYDLETKTLLRTLLVDSSNHASAPTSISNNETSHKSTDVLSLSMVGGDLYACLGNGWCQRWNSNFQTTAHWKSHDRIALSCVITCLSDVDTNPARALFVTGGADAHIKLWPIDVPQKSGHTRAVEGELKAQHDLQVALAEFVGIPSIVNVESHRESCRQAALWLKLLLSQLGAEATLLSTEPGINPPVLATFRGNEECKSRPRLLFYGHYDVIPARKTGWDSDPFTLSGRNGYLYGRGVSDNKGPILAVAFAISELRRKVALDLDIVMLVEGEEEAGSRGFEDTVRKHKDQIGHVDAILISNSYWIGEDIPCITYGLRGVIHANVEISNSHPDLHSGVEGGGVVEPMFDLVNILNSISQGSCILIPNFYDNVRQQSDDERSLYKHLEEVTGQSAQYLAAKWREPSLSIHSVKTSGPGNRTVIPSSVATQLSVRIVPDQDLSQIAENLKEHIEDSFKKLNSPNNLKVSIDKAADWWLGNLDGRWFQELEHAIEEEWGKKPLRIREGGSIPSVPFLEKTFGCPALHFPLGQSSDQAHLANERLSVNNLLKGKAVLERFFRNVAQW